MKKRLMLFCLVLSLCFILTGCNGLSKMYKDVGVKFAEGMGNMTFDEAKSIAEGSEYNVEITDNDQITRIELTDKNKERISVYFRSGSNGDKAPTVSSLFYSSLNKDKSFYASEFSFSTEKISKWGVDTQNVESLAACERFMFGATSGVILIKPQTSDENNSDTSSVNTNTKTYTLRHGKLLNTTINDDTLVIKAKIESSYDNKATVDQNYYNIEDIIKNQGGDKYTEIQYWAVADMTDGSEQKVVSFTVSESVIKKIADNKIVANQMGSYVDDLFIHASLS